MVTLCCMRNPAPLLFELMLIAHFIENPDAASGQEETGIIKVNAIRFLGLNERAKLFGGKLRFSEDVSCGRKVVLSIPNNEKK